MATITSGFLSTTINGLTINKSYPCNSGNYTNKTSRDVTYITIHYTGNAKDSALNNCKYFQISGRNASAHFFCDDSNIYQSVELRNTAWHCGCSTGYKNNCRNTNSFGIEMCTSGNYLVSEKTQINAAYLCAYLCKMIGVTTNSVDTYVVRHYDVVKTNKKCPAQFVSDEAQWTRFKTWVKNILNTGIHETSISNTSTSIITVATPYIYNDVDYRLVFDPTYYSAQYSDLKAAFGTNVTKLLQHFVTSGMKEGRQACEWFNVEIYKANYVDLQNGFGSDLVSYYKHYINSGFNEGRKASNLNVSVSIGATTSPEYTTYTHTQFVKDIQTAIDAKVDGIAGSETLSKTITVSKSKNNRHAVVKAIQKYLYAIGYTSIGTADGIAGSKFDVAVKAFQKANGCVVDGVITAKNTTWKKLLKLT